MEVQYENVGNWTDGDDRINVSLSQHTFLNEPHREKTGFLPMRKQRRRSASR